MSAEIQHTIAPIPPALLAATFDTLASYPLDQRIEPAQLFAISRRIGGSDIQSKALLIRIRALAIVLRDPRWPIWMRHSQACTRDAYCLFDAAVLHIAAALPLTATLRFEGDAFFNALLTRITASGNG